MNAQPSLQAASVSHPESYTMLAPRPPLQLASPSARPIFPQRCSNVSAMLLASWALVTATQDSRTREGADYCADVPDPVSTDTNGEDYTVDHLQYT